jgi:undecaprenyl diphosphate synthase
MLNHSCHNTHKLHLGIIPDGNRRWCKKNQVAVFDLILMLRNMLYNQGKEILEHIEHNHQVYKNFQCINEVSVYVLSKDNLIKRNDDTLNMIRHGLELLIKDMNNPDLIKLKTIEPKIQFVGELDLLPSDIQEMCKYIEDNTSHGVFVITAAIAYDPIEDCRKVLEKHDKRPFQSNIDLVLRSGGEKRSSGFFPLHILYSEWIYLDKLWPDITMKDFENSIEMFLKRDRRFGQ